MDGVGAGKRNKPSICSHPRVPHITLNSLLEKNQETHLSSFHLGHTQCENLALRSLGHLLIGRLAAACESEASDAKRQIRK